MLRWAVWVAVAMMLAGEAAVGQTLAGTGPRFEVASVRRNVVDWATQPARENFPMDASNAFAKVGGRFAVTGQTLAFYIDFAYRLNDVQIGQVNSQLPEWARKERYDIEARAEGEPRKDEMRKMLAALLEERFGLKVHHEQKEEPVYLLEVAKPGRLGPWLRPHKDGCADVLDTDARGKDRVAKGKAADAAGVWPVECGALKGAQSPVAAGLLRVGARDVSMGWFADAMVGGGSLDRAMVDKTGLGGTWDFVMEFTPVYGHKPPPGTIQTDEMEAEFPQALREQLGLKLVEGKGVVDAVVIDRVERPSEN